MYRRHEVGWIEVQEDESWKIVFQGNANEQNLAKNPNCKWAWKQLKQRFSTLEEAQKHIKENNKTFFALLYRGIQDGTVF